MTSSIGDSRIGSALAFARWDSDAACGHREVAPRASSAYSVRTAFEIVTDRAVFDALEADWNALFARTGRSHQVFQTFNWNWHWCNRFLNAEEPRGHLSLAVLAGRRDGHLVTLWPMVLQRHGLLRELSWMGEPVSQYGDVLIDDDVDDKPELLREGWTFLQTALRPDVVRLRKVRDDATIAPLLAALCSQRTAELEAPYLDLSSAPDFATYERRYGRSRRNRLRLLRRLSEHGPVVFHHHSEGAAAAAAATNAIALKRRWLHSRGLLSPALADDRTARFMADVAGSVTRPAGCRVAVLEANGAPAAAQIVFTCKGRLAVHVIAYALDFEKRGVGVLHIEELVRNGYTTGISCIDLLAPNADYKMDWADGVTGVADHALSMSLKGHVYARAYLGYLRAKLIAAVDYLPLGLRRRLGAVAIGTAGIVISPAPSVSCGC